MPDIAPNETKSIPLNSHSLEFKTPKDTTTAPALLQVVSEISAQLRKRLNVSIFGYDLIIGRHLRHERDTGSNASDSTVAASEQADSKSTLELETKSAVTNSPRANARALLPSADYGFYIVDVNHFPSFEHVDSFPQRLVNFCSACHAAHVQPYHSADALALASVSAFASCSVLSEVMVAEQAPADCVAQAKRGLEGGANCRLKRFFSVSFNTRSAQHSPACACARLSRGAAAAWSFSLHTLAVVAAARRLDFVARFRLDAQSISKAVAECDCQQRTRLLIAACVYVAHGVDSRARLR